MAQNNSEVWNRAELLFSAYPELAQSMALVFAIDNRDRGNTLRAEMWKQVADAIIQLRNRRRYN